MTALVSRAGALALLLSLPVAHVRSQTSRPASRPGSRPSFVVIQGEGQGWSSTSVLVDPRVPGSHSVAGLTPHLERLAREGMCFSAFYAASPRCSPSRAALLSGISPARLHMTYVNGDGTERRGRRREGEGETAEPDTAHKLLPPQPVTELPASVKTIAEVLREAGYGTAHFGKWHVGRARPALHGFDQDDGANTNQGPGRNATPNPEEGVAITERGIRFVTAQVEAGRPFYLQLDHYGGGTDDESRPETRRELAAQLRTLRGKEAAQAAILADLDRNLGALLAALERLGILDNTYVIYLTDHGSPGRANGPLSRGKGSVQEGGVRVPMLVRGPGIKPGSRTTVRAIGFDLLPTVASLAGIKALPPEVEGGSMAPVLRGESQATVRRPRPELVIHFPHYDLDNGGPMSAIYVGDHKLIRSYEDGTDRLFDLARDPGERTDLAAKLPERAAELGRLLDAYLKAVDAQMPRPDPQRKQD